MPLTTDDLRQAGLLTQPMQERQGCWRFERAVRVRALKDGTHPAHTSTLINRGEIYTVDMFDENGPYPQRLHCEDVGYWWPIKMFELVPS